MQILVREAVEAKGVDNELWSFARLRPMGEHKANSSKPKRLLLRLQWPTEEPLVVEMNIEADFLERVWKLMLICEKIRRTMRGPAKVIIENAPCHYIAIYGRAPIQRLLVMAKVKEWHQLQFLWIPRDFQLGRIGNCRLIAGMRESWTIVDENGFWIEGRDGNHQFMSIKLGREWMRQNLSDSVATAQGLVASPNIRT